MNDDYSGETKEENNFTTLHSPKIHVATIRLFMKSNLTFG